MSFCSHVPIRYKRECNREAAEYTLVCMKDVDEGGAVGMLRTLLIQIDEGKKSIASQKHQVYLICTYILMKREILFTLKIIASSIRLVPPVHTYFSSPLEYLITFPPYLSPPRLLPRSDISPRGTTAAQSLPYKPSYNSARRRHPHEYKHLGANDRHYIY